MASPMYIWNGTEFVEVAGAAVTYTPVGSLPPGGTTGQTPVKASEDDYDVAWGTPASGGGSGPHPFLLMGA